MTKTVDVNPGCFGSLYACMLVVSISVLAIHLANINHSIDDVRDAIACEASP